eukprot:746193-Hanusia_phi.AAC.2
MQPVDGDFKGFSDQPANGFRFKSHIGLISETNPHCVSGYPQGALDSDEQLLKPIAENKHPNTVNINSQTSNQPWLPSRRTQPHSMQQAYSQMMNVNANMHGSAIPQMMRQQRPIGSPQDFQSRESISPDNIHELQGPGMQVRSEFSEGHSPQQLHPGFPPRLISNPPMNTMQPLPMPFTKSEIQQRFAQLHHNSQNSNSPPHSQVQFNHAQFVQNQDDLADLLASSHIDPNASPNRNRSSQGSGSPVKVSPIQQQMGVSRASRQLQMYGDMERPQQQQMQQQQMQQQQMQQQQMQNMQNMQMQNMQMQNMQFQQKQQMQQHNMLQPMQTNPNMMSDQNPQVMKGSVPNFQGLPPMGNQNMFGAVNRSGSPLNNAMFGMPGNSSPSMQQMAPFNNPMAGSIASPGNIPMQNQLQGLERHFNEPPGANMNMMPGPGFHGSQTSPVQIDGQWQGGSMMNMQPKGYKTVICKFWENNMCTKGASCTFAHGAEDLKRLAGSGPAYRPPISSPGLLSPVKMDRYKTKLCLFHLQSRCCKGPHCPYAHGVEELRAPMPPAVLSAFQRFGTGNGAEQRVDLAALLSATKGIPSPMGSDEQYLRAYLDEVQLQQFQQQFVQQQFPMQPPGLQGGQMVTGSGPAQSFANRGSPLQGLMNLTSQTSPGDQFGSSYVHLGASMAGHEGLDTGNEFSPVDDVPATASKNDARWKKQDVPQQGIRPWRSSPWNRPGSQRRGQSYQGTGSLSSWSVGQVTGEGRQLAQS